MSYTIQRICGKGAKVLFLCALCLIGSVAMLSIDYSIAHAEYQYPRRAVKFDYETQKHWNTAMAYKQERRYELARQHILMALALCDSARVRDALQHELDVLDLQIRTLR